MENQTETIKNSALIAMSGGVDSSVAAMLMKREGFTCEGCTMRLYENDMIGEDIFGTCCSKKDTDDARAVCERIGIPYHILHYEQEFTEKVILPFCESYMHGRTPNPCVDCNRYMKFDTLYRKAESLGLHYIVTGHYARVKEENGHFYLMKGKDANKDQSYVLHDLMEAQLAHTRFPLGEYTKDEIRELAREHGFVTAEKKESQDICFVPDGDYAAMIRRFTNTEFPPGDIIDTAGKVIGRHNGIINYTIGQRRGLGVASEKRLYVSKIDVTHNVVVLADESEIFSREVFVEDFHWITGEAPTGEIRCKAKLRYRMKEQPCVLTRTEDDRARLFFDEPQRAATPGQSAVFYDGDYVLGGGIII